MVCMNDKQKRVSFNRVMFIKITTLHYLSISLSIHIQMYQLLPHQLPLGPSSSSTTPLVGLGASLMVGLGVGGFVGLSVGCISGSI